MDGVSRAAEQPRTALSAMLAGIALVAGVVGLLWFAPDSYSVVVRLRLQEERVGVLG